MGLTINGNTNWIALGPLTFQPSEFVKFFYDPLGRVHVGPSKSRQQIEG